MSNFVIAVTARNDAKPCCYEYVTLPSPQGAPYAFTFSMTNIRHNSKVPV